MEFTLSQKEEILNLYDKMRVTDVRDGMDWMGYHHYGSMVRKCVPFGLPKPWVLLRPAATSL